MKTPTKLRIVGGLLLLTIVILIGRFDVQGIAPLILVIGFAAFWELLIVRRF